MHNVRSLDRPKRRVREHHRLRTTLLIVQVEAVEPGHAEELATRETGTEVREHHDTGHVVAAHAYDSARVSIEHELLARGCDAQRADAVAPLGRARLRLEVEGRGHGR